MKLISISAVLLFGAAVSSDLHAQGRRFQLPPQAQKIVEEAYYLGRARDHDGRVVDGIAFLHPRKGAAKPDGVGGGKPKGGGGGESSCFEFMANGARWRTLEPYYADPTNEEGLNPSDVLDLIEASLGEWETEAQAPIFGPRTGAAADVNGADTVQPDNKNEFLFGAIDEPGVIAVTIVWGRFGGPPHARELVEWDMICDQESFNWSLTGASGAMDFENIFQHEAGHAAGLGHPTDTCTEETMHAYADTGETKKRDLHAGDIAGIRALY